jgi:hypothetical protein
LHGLHFDMMKTSFFVDRVTIVPEKSSRFGGIHHSSSEGLDSHEIANLPKRSDFR